VPIALSITALLVIVAISYQQTIYAYPSGGGSYIVARANLGTVPGLIAAAALLVDYVGRLGVGGRRGGGDHLGLPSSPPQGRARRAVRGGSRWRTSAACGSRVGSSQCPRMSSS
jgi:hypothetical protein